ncbi:MAG: polyprenyl synthetase family protein, partial [bacterium]
MGTKRKEFEIEKYLSYQKERINKALRLYLPPEKTKPSELIYAINYGVLDGGKRIRPILTIAAFNWAGGKGKKILPVACAIELIHSFSLIHDDLPSIDNDDYRRHKLTCHKELERITGDRRIGEAMAILAGDALLSLAFILLAKRGNPRVIKEVSNATFDLVRGEAADVLTEGKEFTGKDLEFIHLNKTASLIKTSIRAGAIMAKANRKEIKALTDYGTYIGLAFQIRDDWLNEIGTEEELGKPVKSDKKHKKATYPTLYGLEKTIAIAHEYSERAKQSLP